jgi:hypothetical protein
MGTDDHGSAPRIQMSHPMHLHRCRSQEVSAFSSAFRLWTGLTQRCAVAVNGALSTAQIKNLNSSVSGIWIALSAWDDAMVKPSRTA